MKRAGRGDRGSYHLVGNYIAGSDIACLITAGRGAISDRSSRNCGRNRHLHGGGYLGIRSKGGNSEGNCPTIVHWPGSTTDRAPDEANIGIQHIGNDHIRR